MAEFIHGNQSIHYELAGVQAPDTGFVAARQW